jgi:hypothetical protein
MGWWNRAKYVDGVLGTNATAHPVGLVVATIKRKIGLVLGNDTSQRVDNPMVVLHRDRKAQLDESGKIKPGSRLASMSAADLRKENDYVYGLSRIAFDNNEDSRSVDAVARASDINRFSEFKDCVTTFHKQSSESGACAVGVESHRCRNVEFYSKPIFAGGTMSRADLVQYDEAGRIIDFNHSLDTVFIEIFVNNMDDFKSDSLHFQVRPDGLYDCSGHRPYITRSQMVSSDIHDAEQGSAHDMDDRRVKDFASYDVSDAFYEFLVRLPNWDTVAHGIIENGVRDAQQ